MKTLFITAICCLLVFSKAAFSQNDSLPLPTDIFDEFPAINWDMDRTALLEVLAEAGFSYPEEVNTLELEMFKWEEIYDDVLYNVMIEFGKDNRLYLIRMDGKLHKDDSRKIVSTTNLWDNYRKAYGEPDTKEILSPIQIYGVWEDVKGVRVIMDISKMNPPVFLQFRLND